MIKSRKMKYFYFLAFTNMILSLGVHLIKCVSMDSAVIMTRFLEVALQIVMAILMQQMIE